MSSSMDTIEKPDGSEFEAETHETTGSEIVPSKELHERFDESEIDQLCQELVTEHKLDEVADGREFAILRLPGTERGALLGKYVESVVFGEAFSRDRSEVWDEYAEYDEASEFVLILDVNGKKPVAAARIIANSDKGLKDLEDLVADDEDNPWIGEIKAGYFEEGETYSPETAKERLYSDLAVDLEFDEDLALDIATRAVLPEYSKPGLITPGLALLHSILQVAGAQNKNFFVAIQDVGPLKMIQRMGEPFRVPSKLNPHPFGGPYDTLPTFAQLDTAYEQMREKSPRTAPALIDGMGIEDKFVTLKEVGQV